MFKMVNSNSLNLNCDGDYFDLDIETSMVDTLRGFPSSDETISVPTLTGPILYPNVSILFTIICATSTALVMLFPLALITTMGSFANCTKVAVTYVMRGFLPMKTAFLGLLPLLPCADIF